MPTRRSSPSPETIRRALDAFGAGLSKAAIARDSGCTTSTLNNWIKRYDGMAVAEIAEQLTPPTDNRYLQIMRKLFEEYASAAGTTAFDWNRSDLKRYATELKISEPDNIGDAIYAMRHGRQELPDEIKALAPEGKHWLLLPNGKSKYRFVLASHFVLEHSPYIRTIKIPDSTPQLVSEYALGDEQAVLARVRYCRLIDIFLSLSAFPLQSHLRTTVGFFNRSQIETDELYVGVDRHGAQYIIPIQAKGTDERIGAVQVIQDIYSCREKFRPLSVRAVAAKTVRVEESGNGPEIHTIALMEVGVDDHYNVHVVREAQYQLVPASMIDESDLDFYRREAEGLSHDNALPAQS